MRFMPSTAPAAAVMVLLSGGRQRALYMQQEPQQNLPASSLGGDAASTPDVSEVAADVAEAAADVARLLKFKEEEESLMKKFNALWGAQRALECLPVSPCDAQEARPDAHLLPHRR